MASPPRGDSYDYTEGASAIDIQEAIRNTRRTRRDSRYGEDGGGSMFDGPGNEVIPSSVSRMSLSEHGRRSSEGRTRRSISRRGSDDRRSEGGRSVERPRRRMSGVSATSFGSMQDDGQDEYPSGEEDEEDDHLSRRSRPKLHTPPRSGVFENLANIFGRGHQVSESPPRSRRPSISSRSSRTGLLRRQSSRRSDAGSDYAIDSEIDSADERWGYSSGEEDDDYDSEDENRGRPDIDTESMDIRSLDERSLAGPSLPLMSGDPIFGGEERIEMGELELLDPPPPGPPSRQSIYIADEDAHVRFVGYETQPVRQFIWRTLCVLTFGILGLIGHWFPRLWLRWVAREKAFKDLKHGFIVAESAYRDIALFPVRILEYPYHISTVFPAEVDQRLPGEANGTSVILDHLLVVDYRYARFALDPRNGLFSLVKDWRDPSWVNIRAIQDGISKDTETQRQILFGDNVIDIEGKSTLSLLIDEVIHPFYVFQIASIILWSLDDYYYYAFCIALISAISIFTTLVETKKTITRMREMSRFSCTVNVYSDGKWQERESTSLVPGDIINLNDPPLSTFPADLFLLSGDAIVNESMLTGESVPVSKIPIKDTDLARWKDSKDVTGDIAKSFLYAGTKVVRIRNSLVAADGSGGRPALGLVVRTGFDTTKGALVRSMLFPKPMGFKFYRDSIRFILVLAGLAGLGFCASAVQFVRLGVKWHTILLRALDLITVVVPPALPATLSIGTSFAIGRLRKLGIFCISPSRVNVGGKINVCCFDKTGTLTEDGLDILGVRAPERNAPRFGELIEDVRDLQINHGKANFLYALATCHSLKQVDGHVIGDPLDVKMFEFTKWTLEEGHVAGTAVVKSKVGEPRPAALVQTVVRPPGSARFRVEDALKGAGRHAHFLELGVIRTFEFVSALRRMSVIVKRLKSNSMEVYVKGAPEVMADICEKDSFPQDYDDLLSYYTKRGYRVIAIAGKSIEGLSWLKAQKMKREQAESGLRFLGLVIFENKLKPGTTPAIQALRQAHLACRMITGDNPLTAVSVARECGLINQAAHVFAPTFIRGNAYTAMSRLEWTCMDEEDWKLDSYSLKPIHASSSHNSLDTEPLDHHDYTLVVTGDVFRWMINHAPLETLQRMLVRTQIYARMSPDEKNEIVERLQGLGYTVLMCGDGANDCAALKAADVGISLSEAEASVAAPFTSRTPDISCVLEVIKEGRAALVTSFSCFKYMALYSLIQFTTITLLYSFASSLGDFQFLYIDLFIIIPIAVTMGRTLPYPRIHPKAPTASLVSKKVLASIIGQILITSAVQFWAYFWVRGRPWYAPPTPKEDTNDDKLEAKNYENSVLFLISCFQYILVAAVFSIGPPYRKPMYTNVLLMASIVLLTLFNVLVLLFPPKPVATILELMTLPFSARLTLLGAAMVNVAVSMAYERWGTQFVSQIIGSIMQIRRNMRVRDGKTYKAVEGGMRS